MSGETCPYLSDQITADSFLHPLPSPLDNRIAEGEDPNSLFNWMEALEPYGLEPTLSFDSLSYPSQDCYQFTEPFSFSSESELLWQQFEEPLPFRPEQDYQQQEFDFPDYPLHSYQQETTQPTSSLDTSTTPSSHNSSSPELSPGSQEETREKSGIKRRKNLNTSEQDPHLVCRKRVRGQKEYTESRNHLDHGYESMSPEANVSSPPYVSSTNLVFMQLNSIKLTCVYCMIGSRAHKHTAEEARASGQFDQCN